MTETPQHHIALYSAIFLKPPEVRMPPGVQLFLMFTQLQGRMVKTGLTCAGQA